MPEMIRVLVVDDHALFRRGVVELLREQADFHVVGEAGLTSQALELSQRLHPRVVLMDVHLPDDPGYKVVPALKQIPTLQVLMLTVSDRDEDLMAALSAGADGYLLKNAEPEELCRAIRHVAAGYAALSPELTARIIQRARVAPQETRPRLSAREREVLVELARGATTADIARRLIISESTVKTHVRHIMEKLDAANRTEAVARSVALGLLEG